jgi:hypothetical protein
VPGKERTSLYLCAAQRHPALGEARSLPRVFALGLGRLMKIRYGFEMELEFGQPAAVVTLLDVHPSQTSQIIRQSDFVVSQPIKVETFHDCHGNVARRLCVDAGILSFWLSGVIENDGCPDLVDRDAGVLPVADLPHDVLPFLLGSRYCETDLLSDFAWGAFGAIGGGGAKVQAICDFVHQRLTFSYPNARATRTASQAMEERSGVCRDFSHLAIALCRSLNIPARYCNGYLGDIGVPADPMPMDFNAWFEAYLGGRWYTFDARHNMPRIGRILVARGRDAMDAPMVTSYGPHRLLRFNVITEEVIENRAAAA